MAISKSRNSIFPVAAACVVWVLFGALLQAHGSDDIVLYASKAPVRAGTWAVVADSTAAGGFAIGNPDLGGPKIDTPLANPISYFEMTFPAYAGKAYHLWVRGKAARNSYTSDSVYVQFSDSVTSSGAADSRIGSTSALHVILQSCTGAAEQGWGWTDNGWCSLGSNVFFQTTGTHTLRVQVREEGLSIDQIVLSPDTYLSASPGAAANDSTILAANAPAVTSSLSISVAASPASGVSPLNVSFTPTVSGSPSSYNWNFGDGQTSTQALATHTYQASGNYTAKLTVTDTSGVAASASTLISVGGSVSGVKLRVMQANIFYGGHGTDNIVNLNRIASWIASLNPDVASLIEVLGGSGDPATITSLVGQKTGIKWYYYYVPKYVGSPEGVMILSKWPIVSTSQLFMSYEMPVAEATLNVNNKLVSFFSTHFQWPSNASSQRQVEANQLVSFASKFAEPRIVAGDFNSQDGTPEINIIEEKFFSGWDTAVSTKSAVAYSDNPPSIYTRTRKSRIDHVFFSKGTTALSVTSGQVPDTRNLAVKPVILLGTTDDKGVRPSDHNFMVINFSIH